MPRPSAAVAETNLAEVQSQRERADQALLQATRTLARLATISARGELGIRGPLAGRLQLQSLVTELYQGLSTQSHDDPTIRRELAFAAVQIARHLEENYSGREQEALSGWRDAEKLYESLTSDEPANPRVHFWFAYCFMRRGGLLRRLGQAEEGNGVWIKAREQWRRHRDRRGARGPDPHNVDFSSTLADCILHSGYMDNDMGRISDAEAAFDVPVTSPNRTCIAQPTNLRGAPRRFSWSRVRASL